MNAISELAMSSLGAKGVSLQQACVITLTTERFTVGYVLEEQAPRPDETALKGWDLDAFTESHPTLIAGISEYFRDGHTPDDLFEDCLRVVVAGAVATQRGMPR